jgi:cytochrome c-type biogenesis protein CcmH/NrfF
MKLNTHKTKKMKLSKITQEKLLWIVPPTLTVLGMWFIALFSIFRT